MKTPQVYNSFKNVYLNNFNLAAPEEDLAFKTLRADCKKEFLELKKEHEKIFAHPAIKQSENKVYPYPDHEILQDESKVTKVTKTLFTRGLGPCMCVIARGNGTNGRYHGMAHISSGDEIFHLNKLKTEFEKKGCEAKTLEFFLIGGQLPYIEENEYEEMHEGSLDSQKELLSQKDQINIVSARFNLAEGDDALSVILTEDEIVWTDGQFTVESKNSVSSDDENSTAEEKMIKRKRNHSEEDLEESIKKIRSDCQLDQKL